MKKNTVYYLPRLGPLALLAALPLVRAVAQLMGELLT